MARWETIIARKFRPVGLNKMYPVGMLVKLQRAWMIEYLLHYLLREQWGNVACNSCKYIPPVSEAGQRNKDQQGRYDDLGLT